MWGCDLTPLFEADGSRLMFFTAFWPLGWQLQRAARPPGLPGDGDLVQVEMVEPRQEAAQLGIEAGDLLRAVSLVGTGPEPSWLDAMLGAQAMPMKKALEFCGEGILAR